MKLDELKNIGKALVTKLEKIGIKSSEDLHKLGSRKAFLKMKTQLNDG
jgi:nucleotidyltransferase/DNA polymerase involved in DNA repair